MEIVIIGLAVLFFLGHALSWFFVKTKIPDLLLLIILGFALGPSGFAVIDTSHLGKIGPILSTVALIVILYEGGLHLSMQDLVRSSSSALTLSLLSFVSISAVSALVLTLFIPLNLAVLTGVGIGSTSSAIVIPMVKFLSIQKNTKTVLSLESAFTDVLTIIIFLSILDNIASGREFNVLQFFMGLGATPLLSVGLGIFSGIFWSIIKKFWKNVENLSFSGEAWSLLTYGLAEFFKFNGAISVLALGFTLSNVSLLPAFFSKILNTEVSQKELSLLSTITFLLRTFFFIYLGLLIQFTSLSVFMIALFLCLLIFLTRYISALLVMKKDMYPRLDAMSVVSMGPRGLACAVLATLPLQKGIEHGDFVQNLIFSIIPLSILLTSVFVSLSEKQGFRDTLRPLFKKYDESLPSSLKN